jgi:hypothetical protein
MDMTKILLAHNQQGEEVEELEGVEEVGLQAPARPANQKEEELAEAKQSKWILSVRKKK